MVLFQLRDSVELNLSRLNHGQPGVQAHPEIAEALVGFQGRGCADGVQPDLCYALLPEALIFQ